MQEFFATMREAAKEPELMSVLGIDEDDATEGVIGGGVMNSAKTGVTKGAANDNGSAVDALVSANDNGLRASDADTGVTGAGGVSTYGDVLKKEA